MNLSRNTLHHVRTKKPLVHCITNYVTIQKCADILLTCGGSPIMADDPKEVAEVTSIADALVLNIGTLHEHTIPAMLAAGKTANARGIPVVLDPVGVGVSGFRKQAVDLLLSEIHFSVIRGNLTEIRCLCKQTACLRGVDADLADHGSARIQEAITYGRALSQKTGAVIVISGETDLITYNGQTVLCKNGSPQMARVTGSGCMLSAVIGAYVGANPNDIPDAVITAIELYAIAGELAAGDTAHIGSFQTAFFDAVDALTAIDAFSMIERRAKLETI